MWDPAWLHSIWGKLPPVTTRNLARGKLLRLWEASVLGISRQIRAPDASNFFPCYHFWDLAALALAYR